MIPFNKPYLHGKELVYIAESVASGKISGDGVFTQKCHQYFESTYNFNKVLLTTSCTDALEMAAILLNIEAGDEIIAPSFTFVSSVNAFVLRGAKIVFADSYPHHPNIDANLIESLVTEKTKAIVVVHYGGIACDMNKIMEISRKYKLKVIEDAAQAIDAFYYDKPLGNIGTFGAFSFHETKNIISGEGGMITINDPSYVKRAEIIREKGTNRSAFFRGEVDKYGWVDIGSSFLPSDIVAAYLFAQLEHLSEIQSRRIEIWNRYYSNLKEIQHLLPEIPDYSTNNGHIFYLICKSIEERTALISYLKSHDIHAVFHYQSLHKSDFFLKTNTATTLPNCELFSDCLIRLPLYFDLTFSQVDTVSEHVLRFFSNKQT